MTEKRHEKETVDHFQVYHRARIVPSTHPYCPAAARLYAIGNGIPGADILIKQRSQTSYENVVNAKQVADGNGLKRVLIVSDPMHMKRAVAMASDIGLEAYPSPTPTTRYQGWRSRMGSLADETYYYFAYLAAKAFN